MRSREYWIPALLVSGALWIKLVIIVIMCSLYPQSLHSQHEHLHTHQEYELDVVSEEKKKEER